MSTIDELLDIAEQRLKDPSYIPAADEVLGNDPNFVPTGKTLDQTAKEEFALAQDKGISFAEAQQAVARKEAEEASAKEDKSLSKDASDAIKEVPENLYIGMLGLGAGAMASIERHAMKAAGAGIFPDEMLKNFFMAHGGKDASLQDRAKARRMEELTPGFLKPRGPMPGYLLSQAVGVAAKAPDIARLALTEKQQKAASKQDEATYRKSPITKISRTSFPASLSYPYSPLG